VIHTFNEVLAFDHVIGQARHLQLGADERDGLLLPVWRSSRKPYRISINSGINNLYKIKNYAGN
jgi:hypothetical protein